MQPGDTLVIVIILMIAVTGAVFAAGRKWQRSVDAWNAWRGMVAAVPGKRRGAFSAVAATFKAVLWAALVVGLALALMRYT